MSPQKPSRRSALFALLLGLTVGLLSAELILRAADRLGWISIWEDARTARQSSIWMASPAPGLLYQHRPNYAKDGTRYTERHGILRPEDVEPEAPAGSFRIAVLGDSVTAAVGLPYEKRFVTRLERILAERFERPVEALNFAVNGYSTAQEAALLESLASRFETHYLLLQYCVNDIRPSDQPSRWFLERPFYLADLADLLGQLFDRRFQRGYTPASYWERLYRDDTDGWSSALEGFRYISEFAASRQVPALVVIFPALSREGWWSGDARGRHAKVASAARAAGLEVLDLLPVYARHPVDALRSHPMDTFHPNSVGHRIAARALAAKLGPMLRRGSSSPG